LHEEYVRARRMHRDAMDAVADFRGRIRDLLGDQAAVHWPPGLARVVAPEHARGGDGDREPRRIPRILEDRVQAHAAGTGLPGRPRAVATQPGTLLPGLAAGARTEQG